VAFVAEAALPEVLFVSVPPLVVNAAIMWPPPAEVFAIVVASPTFVTSPVRFEPDKFAALVAVAALPVVLFVSVPPFVVRAAMMWPPPTEVFAIVVASPTFVTSPVRFEPVRLAAFVAFVAVAALPVVLFVRVPPLVVNAAIIWPPPAEVFAIVVASPTFVTSPVRFEPDKFAALVAVAALPVVLFVSVPPLVVNAAII
jgi:hypothetical protein